MANVSLVPPQEAPFSQVHVATAAKSQQNSSNLSLVKKHSVLEKVLAGKSSGFYSWDVEPGQGVGCLCLGGNLNECLMILQSACGSLEDTKLLFDPNRIHTADVVFQLSELGIQLCFNAISQRLHLITVNFDNIENKFRRRLQLKFNDSVFSDINISGSSVSVSPRMSLVCNTFGPAAPGRFAHGSYFLSYPGVCFEFPLGQDFDRRARQGDHPVDLCDPAIGERSPAATRMFLYEKESVSHLQPAPSACQPDVIVLVGEGVNFPHFSLRFGDSPQAVFSGFGPPDSVSLKPQNNTNSVYDEASAFSKSKTTYFFNYFSRGFDVAFDGSSHVMTKIVLHSNTPGSDAFCQYGRCFFKLLLGNGKEISVTSKWSDVKNSLPKITKPLTLNSRKVYSGAPSFYYSYSGVVFEVIDDAIMSLIIFPVDFANLSDIFKAPNNSYRARSSSDVVFVDAPDTITIDNKNKNDSGASGFSGYPSRGQQGAISAGNSGTGAMPVSQTFADDEWQSAGAGKKGKKKNNKKNANLFNSAESGGVIQVQDSAQVTEEADQKVTEVAPVNLSAPEVVVQSVQEVENVIAEKTPDQTQEKYEAQDPQIDMETSEQPSDSVEKPAEFDEEKLLNISEGQSELLNDEESEESVQFGGRSKANLPKPNFDSFEQNETIEKTAVENEEQNAEANISINSDDDDADAADAVEEVVERSDRKLTKRERRRLMMQALASGASSVEDVDDAGWEDEKSGGKKKGKKGKKR